jgi:ribonucleoside-diphosphate reductase alpha chain
MPISDNARTVLTRRYLARDEGGKVKETVEDMFSRVARSVAAAEMNFASSAADVAALEQSFYQLMTELDFLPNSPTLMNAGRPLGQLSACFVLPVPDSMEGIFDAIKHAALIHKSGGGTGFSFSRLRGQGEAVNTTGGIASGPISFMKVFNAATDVIKQGGTRRGANMGILRVDHPDIMTFINYKNQRGELTNFNLSVGVTEAFMQAVEDDAEYELRDPASGQGRGFLSARSVFESIVDAAWMSGEPGIIFLDRLNRDNAVPTLGEIESTNPCGEQPLLPYESCNLGSINLVNHIKSEADGYTVDWEKLQRTVKEAVHFLDNVIEINKYPLPEIERVTKMTRKIGLGVMGFADLLLYLGLPYNSEQGVAAGEAIMEFINRCGHEASAELAATRGAFPLFEQSFYREGPPLRNATVTTIAPTGTLSIIAGVSSGVEPVFAYVYMRNVLDNTHLIETNAILEAKLRELDLVSPQLMEEIAAHGSLAEVTELPIELREVFVSAHDVTPLWHVRMQAAFQRHTDNAVSKTVNFAKNASREEVRETYLLAYNLGCKGITIYRDGSRDEQVLNLGTATTGEPEPCDCEGCTACRDTLTPRQRPVVTTGFTEKVKIGCGNLYITVNYDEQGVCEVFTNTGRAGGCPSQSEATARLVSIALRSGISSEVLIEQLKGIRCASTIRQKGMGVTSCPDAIARVIEKVTRISNHNGDSYLEAAPSAPDESPEEAGAKNGKFCPECSSLLEHEGGCVSCRNCGYSKCN